jgi:hypothetical protein
MPIKNPFPNKKEIKWVILTIAHEFLQMLNKLIFI